MKNDNIFDKITNDSRLHFIGVGGISMISLAEIFIDRGYTVSGSDNVYSEDIKRLEKKGLIYLGINKAENAGNADVIVYTAAVKDGNPEYDAAKLSKKPMLLRAEVLGYIMSFYKNSVAICGTHGKTTVTSMISYIFEKMNCDPTVLVGAHLDIIGGTMKHGKSDYFIAEACEYKRSFLSFYPHCQVILNVEPDHLDYYKDADDYHSAYDSFMNNLDKNGFAVVNTDDAELVKIAQKHSDVRQITFGTNGSAAVAAKNVKVDTCGTKFDLYINNERKAAVSLAIFGAHNVLNALAALGCAYGFGLDLQKAADALRQFTGADRRFKFRGKCCGAAVYDDYAHHPTEIMATLDTVKTVPHNRSICIYQPHTYSRTKAFFNEFASVFKGVDTVIFADIYAAREADDGTVSAEKLADAARKNGINALYCGGFEKIAQYVKTVAAKDDIIVVMGAGDVIEITDMLIGE